MKHLFTIITFLYTLSSNANLYDAQALYDAKNFMQAYTEYNKLAKLGNIRAQYNLAIMHLSGIGTQKDILKALAWSKTAGSSKSSTKELSNKISKLLTSSQLNEAKILAKNYINTFGVKATRQSLGPIFEETPKANRNNITPSSFNRIERNKKSETKVFYPHKAVKKGRRGWVDLIYDIMPNGTVENIFIAHQYPHELFSPAAIEYLQKQLFDFYLNDKNVTPKHSISSIQRVKFGTYGESGLLGRKVKMKIDDLYRLAKKGNIKAQYQYTNLYYTLLNKSGLAGEKTINQWLFKNARNGMPKSQYQLGINIFYGNSCQNDDEKGLNWIIRAAQNGNIRAQYHAFQILSQNKINNISEKKAQQWLVEAALNDSPIAQFRLAKQLASKNSLTEKEIEQAKNYLDYYAINVNKTIDWYRTTAIIQNKSNQKEIALRSIKKAIKMAKKAKWDLSELKQQKELIQNS